MDREIKVLIVDGQHRSRQSLQALLATWPAVASIREAANGVEALSLAEEYRPDLIVIDVRMPEMGGLETTLKIKDRWPDTGVVVLSMYDGFEPSAIAAGADFPAWILQELQGQTPAIAFDGFRHGLCMLRYDWSVFVPLEADLKPKLARPLGGFPDFV